MLVSHYRTSQLSLSRTDADKSRTRCRERHARRLCHCALSGKLLPCSVGSSRNSSPNRRRVSGNKERRRTPRRSAGLGALACIVDRKSTRLNSSHLVISDAVFCLKKKKN